LAPAGGVVCYRANAFVTINLAYKQCDAKGKWKKRKVDTTARSVRRKVLSMEATCPAGLNREMKLLIFTV
jgi:hypothetical protein